MKGIDQVFISYKSENADIARAVTEALIAGGVSVWFAEYEISSGIFDDYSAIQQAINAGIDHANIALVLTNNRWAESPFCILEIERLLKHVKRGKMRLMEIQIPPEAKPHATWEPLVDAPTITWQGSVADVVDFVNHLDWLPRVSSALTTTSLLSGKPSPLRFGISIDPGALRPSAMRIVPPGGSGTAQSLPGEFYMFRGRIDGVPTRMLVSVIPFETALGQLSVLARGSANDRDVYNSYRVLSDHWLSSAGQKGVGLHLKFWNGRSHIGLTSLLPGVSDDIQPWERRYAITVHNRVRCLRCGGTELFPYYRQDLTGMSTVYTICGNQQCSHRREIQLSSFSARDLQWCPECCATPDQVVDVQPDEARLAASSGMSEYRFICMSRQANDPGRFETCGARMIVPTNLVGNIGEVDVSVVFDIPKGDQNQHATFARLAPFCDAVVDSIVYEPPRWWNFDLLQVLTMKAVVIAQVWAIYGYVHMRKGDPFIDRWVLVVLGALGTDLLMTTMHRDLRDEAIHLGMRWGWRVRLIPMFSLGRLLDQYYNTWIGSLLSVLVSTVPGLLAIGWLLIPLGWYQRETSVVFWILTGANIYAAGRAIISINRTPSSRQSMRA